MGDQNQLIYLKARVPTIDGPVLEIGSRQVGSTSSFRDFYKGAEYVGVDVEHGPGVDMVCDIQKEPPLAAGAEKFALVICCSVLEHVANPWVAAVNIENLVRAGGKLYLSVPWVWRWHPYPDDYWRFSWSGVKALFPDFEWGEAMYSTTVMGEFFKAEPESDNARALMQGPRKYLPYLMLNMIGTRK